MLLTRSSLSFKINRIHLLSLYLLQLLLTVSLNGHNDKSTRVAMPSLQWKFVLLGLSLLAMTFSFLAVTLNFLILFYSPQGFATRVVSPQQHICRRAFPTLLCQLPLWKNGVPKELTILGRALTHTFLK